MVLQNNQVYILHQFSYLQNLCDHYHKKLTMKNNGMMDHKKVAPAFYRGFIFIVSVRFTVSVRNY